MKTGSMLLATVKKSSMIVPEITLNDRKIGQSFDDVEASINNEDDLLINILKYSFVLRYLSNNQVIVFSSLLDANLPLNLHLSNQALSSGMKPQTEKYLSNSPEYKSSYESIFSSQIDRSALSTNPPKVRKIYLSGYTGNILVNDPFFSQMFMLFMGLILILAALLRKNIIRDRQPQIVFYNSISFKLFLFLLSQLPKMIESSLLTILITNYVVMSTTTVS